MALASMQMISYMEDFDRYEAFKEHNKKCCFPFDTGQFAPCNKSGAGSEVFSQEQLMADHSNI
jgi:hypothetical protein